MITLKGDELYYENGTLLGHIFAKEDGYYVFWPKLNGGCWGAQIMHEIADLLDSMNVVWDDELQAFFNK